MRHRVQPPQPLLSFFDGPHPMRRACHCCCSSHKFHGSWSSISRSINPPLAPPKRGIARRRLPSLCSLPRGALPHPDPPLKTGEGVWFKLRQLWLSKCSQSLGCAPMRVFPVPNASEALRRQEQRKSSQRDARRRALSGWRAPKLAMKRAACKAVDKQ